MHCYEGTWTGTWTVTATENRNTAIEDLLLKAQSFGIVFVITFDIYAHQLFGLNHGYGLYEPDPAGQYDRIRVGDVGYVLFGGFQRLFNCFVPESDPINRLGVPEGFEPLPAVSQVTYRRTPLTPGAMWSSKIRKMRGGLGVVTGSVLPVVQAGASIELGCSSQQGAALVIKHPAYREDSSRRRALARYMLQNYTAWLIFARQILDHDIQLRDLVLVSGYDLTADWATATFADRSQDSSITFQVGLPCLGSVEVNMWGEWSTSAQISHRCGPQPLTPPRHTVHCDNEHEDHVPHAIKPPLFDQCIFIRSFRVKERSYLLPATIKAAGEESEDFDRYDEPNSPDLALIECYDHLAIADGCSRTTTDSDAYDAVFNYIFKKSDAEVALVHDDDICNLTSHMEAGKQQVDDVQNYLEQLEPAVELLDDCGYTGVVGRARVYCLGRLDIDRSSIEGYSPSLLSTTSSESKNFDILPSGVQSVRSVSAECITCHPEPILRTILDKFSLGKEVEPDLNKKVGRSASSKQLCSHQNKSGASRDLSRRHSNNAFLTRVFKWDRPNQKKSEALPSPRFSQPKESNATSLLGRIELRKTDIGLTRSVEIYASSRNDSVPPPYEATEPWNNLQQFAMTKL